MAPKKKRGSHVGRKKKRSATQSVGVRKVLARTPVRRRRDRYGRFIPKKASKTEVKERNRKKPARGECRNVKTLKQSLLCLGALLDSRSRATGEWVYSYERRDPESKLGPFHTLENTESNLSGYACARALRDWARSKASAPWKNVPNASIRAKVVDRQSDFEDDESRGIEFNVEMEPHARTDQDFKEPWAIAAYETQTGKKRGALIEAAAKFFKQWKAASNKKVVITVLEFVIHPAPKIPKGFTRV